jgi:hypothetical protein
MNYDKAPDTRPPSVNLDDVKWETENSVMH